MRDVKEYFKSCRPCQLTSAVAEGKENLLQLVSLLFEAFSIYFAGPLPRSGDGKAYVLSAVENLSGWPIVRATTHQTADVALDFFREEIVG